MGKYKEEHGTTRIGDFLRAAKEAGKDWAPSILDLAGDITGIDALNKISDKIEGDPKIPQQDKEIAKAMIQKDIEMYRIEVQDRDSARSREVEMAKSGKTDWLMYAAGITALGTFILMVYAVIFMEVNNNSLFHQLMGIIEGVALTIFAYYFGTSKGSKDKDDIIRKG